MAAASQARRRRGRCRGVLRRGPPQPGRGSQGSSQNNLAAEFLGDYVYAAATRTYGAAVWNDVRRAADCPAIDTYRQALHDEAVAAGGPVAEPEEPRGVEDAVHHEVTQEPEAVAPSVQQVCAGTFGNSDVFGGTYADPTPVTSSRPDRKGAPRRVPLPTTW
jgi:hypothetical protein